MIVRALDLLEQFHRKHLIRGQFYGFHARLHRMALRGLGVLNYQDAIVSGEDNFLRLYLSEIPTAVVFDVGAFEGEYAKRCLRYAPRAEVYAFEPNPLSFKRLENLAKKSGFSAEQAACGEREGSTTLYDVESAEGSHYASFYREVIEDLWREKTISHKVEVISLDSFVEKRSISKIHLLKIDTEGHEINVLRGFSKAINSGIVDVIHFEFNEMNVVSRTFLSDFRELLQGYVLHRLLPDSLVLIEDTPKALSEIFAYQNIVAVRSEERAIFKRLGISCPERTG